MLKKLMYYSPYIPFVGIATTLYSAVHHAVMGANDEDVKYVTCNSTFSVHFFPTMVVQSIFLIMI